MDRGAHDLFTDREEETIILKIVEMHAKIKQSYTKYAMTIESMYQKPIMVDGIVPQCGKNIERTIIQMITTLSNEKCSAFFILFT